MGSLNLWRFGGIVAIIILGFLLHFIYAWTGNSTIVGLFAPVNESVWEHFKLGYWSVILFSIVEYPKINYKINNYFFAKLIGILALELTIVIIFYSYTFIMGRDIFWIDISTYIIAAIVCQYLTYSIFQLASVSKLINRISLVVIITIGVLFAVVSHYPPHISLFMDSKSNSYGISR